MAWTRVIPEADAAVGAAQPVRAGCDELLICRPAADRVHALENVCSHDDAPLGAQSIDDGCVTCPRHGARFDMITGAVLRSPAPVDIAAYPARIRDGWVEVDLED